MSTQPNEIMGLTPSEYFELLKEKKNVANDDMLKEIYDNCLILLNKYHKAGQLKAIEKLIFHLETIEKEREIVKSGIDTFVYRDDIEEYIDSIAGNVVKLIELENYEREIPDDIVEKLAKVKDKFDKCYVVFTDYTGKMERKIEKIRREKDPILFGTFQDQQNRTIIDRFYFIGDWIDEYCDLTLDKMVNEVKKAKDKDIEMSISTPADIEALKGQLRLLKAANGSFVQTAAPTRIITKEKPAGFFSKIFSFFKGGKV